LQVSPISGLVLDGYVCTSGAMDAQQLTALSSDQLIALALAVLCEFSRRLSVPITMAADIGETTANEAGPSAGHTSVAAAAASQTPPWAEPAPSTPTGPSRPNQCCFGCGVPGCSEYCGATSPHERHRCAYHYWY